MDSAPKADAAPSTDGSGLGANLLAAQGLAAQGL